MIPDERKSELQKHADQTLELGHLQAASLRERPSIISREARVCLNFDLDLDIADVDLDIREELLFVMSAMRDGLQVQRGE